MVNFPPVQKMSLKEADLAWQRTDLEVERLTALESQLQQHYNNLNGKYAMDSTAGLIKSVQKAIAEQLRYQSELEMYLIENEAPGWTST